MKWVSSLRRPILSPPGLGHVAHAETRQHRTQQHHRPPEAAGPAAVVVRAQVVRVDVGGSERIALFGQALHFDAHRLQQLDELYHVQDLRDVVYDYLFLREQRGAEDLKRLVFGALGRDFTAQPAAAFDFEYCHVRSVLSEWGRRTLRQTPLRISRNISHYFTNIVKTVRRAKFVRAVGVYFLFHNEGCKKKRQSHLCELARIVFCLLLQIYGIGRKSKRGKLKIRIGLINIIGRIHCPCF